VDVLRIFRKKIESHSCAQTVKKLPKICSKLAVHFPILKDLSTFCIHIFFTGRDDNAYCERLIAIGLIAVFFLRLRRTSSTSSGHQNNSSFFIFNSSLSAPHSLLPSCLLRTNYFSLLTLWIPDLRFTPSGKTVRFFAEKYCSLIASDFSLYKESLQQAQEAKVILLSSFLILLSSHFWHTGKRYGWEVVI
jgi:hypothetical protein